MGYSGGKTRLKDAAPFTLSAGEERHGEDIEVPVSKLFTICGSLIAAKNGHALNGASLPSAMATTSPQPNSWRPLTRHYFAGAGRKCYLQFRAS